MKYFKIDKNENKIIIDKTKSYNVNSDIIDLLIDLELEKDNYKNRLNKAIEELELWEPKIEVLKLFKSELLSMLRGEE